MAVPTPLPGDRPRSASDPTPPSLLDRARGRDAEAWRQLVEVYQPWLRAWLARYIKADEADDLVQEVLTVLVEQLPHFRHNGQKGAFRAWLRGITVNRLRELWRERKRRPLVGGAELEEILDQLSDGGEQSRQWEQQHDRHLVTRLLAMIASDFEEKTWQAFRLFVMEGKTAASVAQTLGMSRGAVWTAKSRVMARLRQVSRNLLD